MVPLGKEDFLEIQSSHQVSFIKMQTQRLCNCIIYSCKILLSVHSIWFERNEVTFNFDRTRHIFDVSKIKQC